MRVFNAPDRADAERHLEAMIQRHQKAAPKLAEWLEGNVREGLTTLELP